MSKRALKLSKERGIVKSVLSPQDWLKSQLDTIANGEWVLSLSRVQRPRSNAQNSLMWVWFGIIAQAWSEAVGRVFTAQNVHDAYCQMFLPITTPNGINLAGSTSRLTTEQFTDFLNKVQADAQAEYGIYLPSPEEAYYAQWQEGYGL